MYIEMNVYDDEKFIYNFLNKVRIKLRILEIYEIDNILYRVIIFLFLLY